LDSLFIEEEVHSTMGIIKMGVVTYKNKKKLLWGTFLGLKNN